MKEVILIDGITSVRKNSSEELNLLNTRINSWIHDHPEAKILKMLPFGDKNKAVLIEFENKLLTIKT